MTGIRWPIVQKMISDGPSYDTSSDIGSDENLKSPANKPLTELEKKQQSYNNFLNNF